MFFFKKSMLFFQSHLLLITTGVICELFYLFYFVRQFPLLSHYRKLTDIEGTCKIILSPSFAAFIIVMYIVFALFGFAWWEELTNTMTRAH